MKKTKPEKWKPEGHHFQMSWVGCGVCLYSCFATNCDAPIGSIWIRLTSMKPAGTKDWLGVAYVLDIYVPGKWRRMGIGTWMMKQVLDMYGILQTGNGTKEGGMALMKSLGWKQVKETGDWFLRGKSKPVPKN